MSRSPAGVVAADVDARAVDPITDADRCAACGYRCDDEAATRDSENARPRYARGSSQLVASRVAPLLAEPKNADRAGAILRFGQKYDVLAPSE